MNTAHLRFFFGVTLTKEEPCHQLLSIWLGQRGFRHDTMLSLLDYPLIHPDIPIETCLSS